MRWPPAMTRRCRQSIPPLCACTNTEPVSRTTITEIWVAREGGLTSKIHAAVDTNGLPVHLASTPGEAHDNRLCSVFSAPCFHKGCYSRIVDTTRTGSGSLRSSTEHGRTFRRNEIAKTDLLQPASGSCAELDRTVLQQDQAMSARRDPVRQTRSQLSGVHQARINPNLNLATR
jgi:hypothetical protein